MKRTCAHPYCPNIADNGHIYCDAHLGNLKPKPKLNRRKPTEDSELTKAYNTPEWRQFSKDMIANHPTCCTCGSTTDLVCDHQVYSGSEMLELFGEFVLRPELYVVKCRSCNSRSQGVIRPRNR